jgi:hypothetical protein
MLRFYNLAIILLCGKMNGQMIKKIKGKYTVLSEKTGRSFGSYPTKAEAEHRLGQIEMFKHMKGGATKASSVKRKHGK